MIAGRHNAGENRIYIRYFVENLRVKVGEFRFLASGAEKGLVLTHNCGLDVRQLGHIVAS